MRSTINRIIREAVDGDAASLHAVLEGVVNPDEETVQRCLAQVKKCLDDPRIKHHNVTTALEPILKEYTTPDVRITTQNFGGHGLYSLKTHRIIIHLPLAPDDANWSKLTRIIRHELTHKEQHARSGYAAPKLGRQLPVDVTGKEGYFEQEIKHANRTQEIMAFARETVMRLARNRSNPSKQSLIKALGTEEFRVELNREMDSSGQMTPKARNQFYRYAYAYANQFPDERVAESITEMEHIFQELEYDCGPTCIKMVAKHLGKGQQYSLSDITQICGSDNQTGTDDKKMAIGLKHLAIPFKVGDAKTTFKLREALLDGKLIILRTLTRGIKHWVVVYGYKDGKFQVNDPWLGQIKYSEDELLAIWKPRDYFYFEIGTGNITEDEDDAIDQEDMICYPCPRYPGLFWRETEGHEKASGVPDAEFIATRDGVSARVTVSEDGAYTTHGHFRSFKAWKISIKTKAGPMWCREPWPSFEDAVDSAMYFAYTSLKRQELKGSFSV
jgi:hypothetical protein